MHPASGAVTKQRREPLNDDGPVLDGKSREQRVRVVHGHHGVAGVGEVGQRVPRGRHVPREHPRP